jgi:hypothetical protein
MKPPKIEWDYKHLPSNRDIMHPLGTIEVDEQTLFVAVNETKKELLFIWNESYGKLISGGE